jgi:hypothetical protein
MRARIISIGIILFVALIVAGFGLMIKKEKSKIKKDLHLPKF